MRALRKIVFINSAHIRYAEVKLDGNVHFIGTQGVGKSTLLRAILFFYNADKMHLGIPKEMKAFDEFYLPHANSYIVFEVEHEHGPFSILTFRSSGRACYRFIDAAYSKDWLVNQAGEVTAEAKVIRERIGDAYMSKIIDRYELYRDILYGNRQAVDKDLARFQLMESNRYQNIPRSIQNVFLNSRLDANFIKDIIIRSMSEQEANIDLGYFRRQVSDFEQEYRDISCWYKLNAKGESTVRKQADNVVKSYHELLFKRQLIEQLCGELNYSLRVAKEKLPLVQKRIEELTEEINRQKRLLGELQLKYDHEKGCINQQKGVIDEKLKRLKERQEYYAQHKIEDILERFKKEDIKRSELESLKNRLADLTSKYNDVTSKFKALVQGIEAQLQSFINACQERKLQLGLEKQDALTQALNQFQSRQAQLNSDYEEKFTLINNTLERHRQEESDLEKELLKLKYWQPYKEEIVSLEKQQDTLLLRQKELEGLISTTTSDIRQLQTEFDKESAQILAKAESLKIEKQNELNQAQSELDQIEELLNKTKGSLYEWLEQNRPDWEQTIGKVISEKQVLYQADLHPQLTEGSSFYGLKLDLSALPLCVRKPSELKKEKAQLEKLINTLNSELRSIQADYEKQIEELKANFSPKMKELRAQKSMLETELQMIPQKLKGIKLKQIDYTEKTNQSIKQRQTELAQRQAELAQKLSQVQAEAEKLKAEKTKKLAQIDSAHKSTCEQAQRLYEQGLAQIDSEIGAEKARIELQKAQIRREEMEELMGRGADTKMVEQCRKAISEVEGELSFIEASRRMVYDYLHDKDELFDHEQELKDLKKQIAEKLAALDQKYALRRQRHEENLAEIEKEASQRFEEKKGINEDIKAAQDFIGDSNLCPMGLMDAAERQTLRTPSGVVRELTGEIVARQNSEKQLKQSINIFKQNFSAKNTFNFKVELSLDEDYLDFANNLDDFLINNKIEEYRSRTSQRYVDILARVSKEMGELTRHESDVERVIHDINADFRERNFAGVIKLIALQSVPSSDKMVQLMKRIKEFNDDNQFAMGEMNLFSSSNRDDINEKAVRHLLDFMKSLLENPHRQYLTLSDLFQLQFRVVENDNDTGWVEKLSHVGSEGTDTLVKAMINIMLINVFKTKVSKRFGEFRIHCMMDEIGKLHPQNVKGILDFANARNILLINSSPTTYNVSDYKYTYLLSKDTKSQTVVRPLIALQ